MLQITIEVPKQISDAIEDSGGASLSREYFQSQGISEYQAKIFSFLLRNGKVNFNYDADIIRSVLLPDIHHPDHDRACMNAVNMFIQEFQPDEIIYLGDQMSLDCVSHWNANKPKLIEGDRIKKDCDAFNRDVLQVHEQICPDAHRVFFVGNHENRVNWFVEKVPQVEGLVEVEKVLDLEARGYDVVPFNQVYRVGGGKLRAIHGFYWNKYHAAKTAHAFESNVVYGHVHNYQAYAKTNPVDKEDYHMATSLPCLCTLQPAYAQNKPNRYINGFGIVETNIETRNFNLYPVIINDGVFIWNRRVYDGNLI